MRESPETSACAVVRRVLAEHLEDLAAFVDDLGDAAYNATPSGGSSIGAHVRHSLDHARALLAGLPEGLVDYEDRRRGGPEETSAAAAADVLRELAQHAQRLEDAMLGRPITIRNVVDPQLPAVDLASDGLREAWFVVSHSIHHNSLIAYIAALQDLQVPPGFGYAPSTLAYLAGR